MSPREEIVESMSRKCRVLRLPIDRANRGAGTEARHEMDFMDERTGVVTGWDCGLTKLAALREVLP